MRVIGFLRKRLSIRRTIRLRLTLLWGTLFVVCGGALLLFISGEMAATVHQVAGTYTLQYTSGPPGITTEPYVMTQLRSAVDGVRLQQLHRLIIVSALGLGAAIVASGVLGWWMAGRALRPVRTMITKVRRLSERNLHERLAVTGPNDELTDLGATFDGLLGRLETAFDAQTTFVANASHELRTPLTVQRTMLEVALADPDADVESLRAVCGRVLAIGEDQARLIEALLTLARSQRGLDRWDPVDISAVAREVLDNRPVTEGIRVDTILGPAWTAGDSRLVERLVTNLVDNAVRHNTPDGWVAVWTGRQDGQPILRVVNTGPVVPADRVDMLLQPFQRMENRTGHDGGLGLGLSIVAAIAEAHGARLVAEARPEGGLAVTVMFTADVPATVLAPV